MLNMKVDEAEKTIYVEVSGYVSSKDAKSFLNNYKQYTRSMRSSQYKLVVNPSVFECENNEDLRDVCMAFFKSGYKKMYLIDPNANIINMMNLGKLEQKMFNKAVKVVGSIKDIR